MEAISPLWWWARGEEQVAGLRHTPTLQHLSGYTAYWASNSTHFQGFQQTRKIQEYAWTPVISNEINLATSYRCLQASTCKALLAYTVFAFQKAWWTPVGGCSVKPHPIHTLALYAYSCTQLQLLVALAKYYVSTQWMSYEQDPEITYF